MNIGCKIGEKIMNSTRTGYTVNGMWGRVWRRLLVGKSYSGGSGCCLGVKGWRSKAKTIFTRITFLGVVVTRTHRFSKRYLTKCETRILVVIKNMDHRGCLQFWTKVGWKSATSLGMRLSMRALTLLNLRDA